MAVHRPKVYLDLAFEDPNSTDLLHRIEIELFKDVVPKTCENFRALCTGEVKHEGKKLSYKGTTFHLITKNQVIQGGDIDNLNGKGGRSIYGPTFPDENFVKRHLKPGTVSMSNYGPNTNNSQFFIQLNNEHMKWLDSKHVVFGHVTKGMGILRTIESRFGSANGIPRGVVRIEECGRIKRKEKSKNSQQKENSTKTNSNQDESDEESEDQNKNHKNQNESDQVNKDEVSDSNKASDNNKPSCSKCGFGLGYVRRVKVKVEGDKERVTMARFICKNQNCRLAVNLPNHNSTNKNISSHNKNNQSDHSNSLQSDNQNKNQKEKLAIESNDNKSDGQTKKKRKKVEEDSGLKQETLDQSKPFVQDKDKNKNESSPAPKKIKDENSAGSASGSSSKKTKHKTT